MSRRPADVLDRPELRPTEVTRGEVEDLLYLEAADPQDPDRYDAYVKIVRPSAENPKGGGKSQGAAPDRGGTAHAQGLNQASFAGAGTPAASPCNDQVAPTSVEMARPSDVGMYQVAPDA